MQSGRVEGAVFSMGALWDDALAIARDVYVNIQIPYIIPIGSITSHIAKQHRRAGHISKPSLT